MEINILLSGLVLGFSIAAPVGPIGILCIRRTLAEGRASGLLTGLGAATADGFFGGVASFGLSVVSDFLIGQQFWFRMLGGAFLYYLGVRTLLSAPATQAARSGAQDLSGIPQRGRPAPLRRGARFWSVRAGGNGLLSAYLTTLLLTLTNPVTILFFAAVFVSVAASGARLSAATAVQLVAGVFLGSAAWWLFLSVTVSLARAWLTPPRMRWVNRLSGPVVIVFGIAALLGLRG